jgi:hypothetical protein
LILSQYRKNWRRHSFIVEKTIPAFVASAMIVSIHEHSGLDHHRRPADGDEVTGPEVFEAVQTGSDGFARSVQLSINQILSAVPVGPGGGIGAVGTALATAGNPVEPGGLCRQWRHRLDPDRRARPCSSPMSRQVPLVLPSSALWPFNNLISPLPQWVRPSQLGAFVVSPRRHCHRCSWIDRTSKAY